MKNETQRLPDVNFWKGKRVFLTGHTGFKGAWLSLWLKYMGAEVTGYSLEPETQSLYNVAEVNKSVETSYANDIRDVSLLKDTMLRHEPDVVFHLAAQSLVRPSYEDPCLTFSTNMMGTVNVLEAARFSRSVRAVVIVTSDKCYENKEVMWGYRENDAMGGFDPYSASKGCAELITASYRRAFFKDSGVAVSSARAGNVIGGGDWAKDRLIPDIVHSFNSNDELVIRNPTAKRPWQHVLEPLSGYLILAESMCQSPKEFSEGWNFGPAFEDVQTVEWIVDHIAALYGVEAKYRTPLVAQPHEAHLLALDCTKAAIKLDWRPRWNLSEALERIVEWNRLYVKGDNMNLVTLAQIQLYMSQQ